ncbi:MAG: ATP synthase F0 subunit B [Candidatus Pacebacteria bacterium]|nr:ATP synthase F0 subunit B [Candidatus Paceibacterota bacterium]
MEIQISQIIFQAINFFVVFGALTYLLVKPIVKILDQRAQRVADAQKAASETLLEKEQIDAYKAKVKKATDKKAAEALDEAKQRATDKEKELINEAKDKAKAEIKKMTSDWKIEAKKQESKMKKEFEVAVLKAAEKVIGKSLDAKKHSALIDSELDALLKAI